MLILDAPGPRVSDLTTLKIEALQTKALKASRLRDAIGHLPNLRP